MKDYEKLLNELQNSLIKEKTSYRKRILKEKIDNLRKEYEKLEKLEIEIKNTTENQNLLKNHDFMSNPLINMNKIIIKNERNKMYKSINCSVLHVENSEYLNVLADNADTLYLLNVNNSEVSGTFEQIRLFGCKNVNLKIFTKTPVTIEKCEKIFISSNGVEDDNQFDNVCDFSDPVGNKNYKILKE
ncbi:hypothetical protein DMUE_2270 [Dictyocoela muelleri]|nr:hypothetical protein DMUE_2270 [Dictyocoela muelleri]